MESNSKVTDAPGGKKEMHASNQHTLKPVYIGEILKDGQFRIINSSDGLGHMLPANSQILNHLESFIDVTA
jgi:hypothetical protein